MKMLSYRTIIQKDGKHYRGSVPVLPGCHTQGQTIEKTRENLREAILGWLESRVARNMPIPKEDSLETIETVEFNSLPETRFAYA